MKDLSTSSTTAFSLRNLHRWAAHAMVLAADLHMLRVFCHRGYRPPRQFNRVIGVILLLVTLLRASRARQIVGTVSLPDARVNGVVWPKLPARPWRQVPPFPDGRCWNFGRKRFGSRRRR